MIASDGRATEWKRSLRGRVAGEGSKAGAESNWQSAMAAVQSGDAAAYQRLLRAILPMLPSLIRRQRVSPEQVEDVVQDTLLTIHRVRHTYDPQRPLFPWVAAIAQRRAIDALRRSRMIDTWEQVTPGQLQTLADPGADGQVELIEWRERQTWLYRALGHLPRKQREAVELMKIRGLSVAEAAVASGQSAAAIKVNMHRARESLRALSREGSKAVPSTPNGMRGPRERV